MRLWRPVGIKELEQIYDSGLTAFPPRLPEQPIFYPVLNLDYAIEIARDWNVPRPPFAGYVTEFEVDDAFAGRYERQIVGRRSHEELWVPAEDLPAFNAQITPPIRVVAAYFGEDFQGFPAQGGRLSELSAAEQLAQLCELLTRTPDGFEAEIKANHLAVFLNFAFWEGSVGAPPEPHRPDVVESVRATWHSNFPKIPLPACGTG